MIKLENVDKFYPMKNGRRQVLKDICITIDKGNDIGILGRNGAGKSTLFRLISGTELPDGGVITRKGRISWPLGFTGGFHGSLTGKENILFVARIYEQNARIIFDYVTEFAELGQYMNMPIKSYSSGMRARLAFGLSMAIDFDYYLIDEVIAVGDTNFKKKCRETLKEKRKKATVIMVSHSIKILKEFCRSGAVIVNGSLQYFDKLDDAVNFHEKEMVSSQSFGQDVSI